MVSGNELGNGVETRVKTTFITKKRGDYAGISVFERQIIDGIEDFCDILEYSLQGGYPLSRTVNRILSRELKKKIESYDQVLISDQALMVIDPEKVEAQLIPYVHDIFPATKCFNNYIGQALALYNVRRLEKCQKILTASKTVKQEIENSTRFNGEAQVIYQGVDNLPEIKQRQPRDIDLLYVGSLQGRKNPGLLRRTFSKAIDQGYNVVHVTDDPKLPGQNKQDITDKSLAEMYNRTRYYLHSSFAEGFGRCPVESQRYGATPLALDIPINQEILGEKGRHWKPISGTEDVLQQLKNRETVHRTFPQENSHRFKWEKTVEELREALDLNQEGIE